MSRRADTTGGVLPYRNPLRHVKNLRAGRVDQGVDFTGSGPLYAPGRGVILQTLNPGWPGGAFIAERLTAGPYRGNIVYFAEDIQPTVHVGDHVNSSTKIGEIAGGNSIEVGWAAPPPNLGQALAYVEGQSCYTGHDPGCHVTGYGASMSAFLVALGAPGGNKGGPVHGSVKPGFPAPSSQAGNTAGSGSSGGTGCIIPLPKVGPIGGGCLLNRGQARAIIGGLMITAAIPIGLVGGIVLAAFAFRRSGIGPAIGRSAEAAGSGIAVIPGMQAAGAAVAGAGSAEARRGQRQQREKQAKEGERRQAREKSESDAQARNDEKLYKQVEKRTSRQSSRQAPPDRDEPPF